MRRLIALLVLCNCGRVGFDGLDGGVPGNSHDGASGTDAGSGSGDVLANGCISPGYGDDFNEVNPCGKLGTTSVFQGGISTSNGVLTMSPNPNTASDLECVRDAADWNAAGAFAEVIQPLPGNSETNLSVTDTTTLAAFMITEQHANLIFTSPAGTVQINYDPTAQRWWRIRPYGGDVIAETSPDGTQWTSFARAGGTLPSTLRLTLGVFETDPVANPGSAMFGGIDVCPP